MIAGVGGGGEVLRGCSSLVFASSRGRGRAGTVSVGNSCFISCVEVSDLKSEPRVKGFCFRKII